VFDKQVHPLSIKHRGNVQQLNWSLGAISTAFSQKSLLLLAQAPKHLFVKAVDVMLHFPFLYRPSLAYKILSVFSPLCHSPGFPGKFNAPFIITAPTAG